SAWCSFLCEGSAVWPPRHPPGRDSRLGKGAGARATTRGGVGDATNKRGSNPDTGRGRLGHERAVHVPVIDLDQVSALLQTPADLFGDHDRTVPTAGA